MTHHADLSLILLSRKATGALCKMRAKCCSYATPSTPRIPHYLASMLSKSKSESTCTALIAVDTITSWVIS